jgi:hypothetical protein
MSRSPTRPAVGGGAFTLAVDQGAFALSGQDVAFLRSLILAAVQGAYALNGQGVNLLTGRRLVADAGAYALTGFAILLTHAGGGVVLPHYVIASLDVAGGRLADAGLTSVRVGDLHVADGRIATLEED